VELPVRILHPLPVELEQAGISVQVVALQVLHLAPAAGAQVRNLATAAHRLPVAIAAAAVLLAGPVSQLPLEGQVRSEIL
jgi:hypothetical protein